MTQLEVNTTLQQLEAVVEANLQAFYKVGKALQEIRDKKLYLLEFDTFEDYCQGRWGWSRQNAYNYINGVAIINGLPNLPSPTNVSQTTLLGRIPEEQRATVWQEIVQHFGTDATKTQIVAVTTKHIVENNGGFLATLVKDMQITPMQALNLQRQLNKLPPYYTHAVESFGFKDGLLVNPDVLQELRALEYSDKDTVQGVLLSGVLNDVPLHKLSITDIIQHKRQLHYEQTKTKQELAVANQQISNPNILQDSVNDVIPPISILFGDSLTPNGYKTLCTIVYKDAPDTQIKYGYNTYVHPREIVHGAKPEWLVRLAKYLQS